ncbi:SURF1 family protein [Streptomyces boninensis]|uniref:SURF1 family cytochrome oxidase biogenesis protein n=1 Tax=Streptomyces boninensis TaxID=2039455 RepID=UPI003B227F74
MYRFLLTRQWVSLTLFAVLLIPAMIELGFWQLHRHEARVDRNDHVAHQLGAKPLPVADLTSPGHEVSDEDTWRTVTAKGRYDAAHEVVVRQRTSTDGKQGYFVVTPLRLDDGRFVLVNRGWVTAGQDLTKFPTVPKPPAGEVTVTGRLLADETTEASSIKDREGLPGRQVMLINGDKLAKELPGKILGGYIQLTKTTPAPTGQQPERVAPPDHSGIGPHLAYAIQWWIFAAAVPFGWWVLVRRERKERESARSEDTPDVAAAEPVTAK